MLKLLHDLAIYQIDAPLRQVDKGVAAFLEIFQFNLELRDAATKIFVLPLKRFNSLDTHSTIFISHARLSKKAGGDFDIAALPLG
jgi:hypothetical protein